ncbi:hypothetical protein V5799_005587 [Amblyomma americanum]|uniref:SCP domain-containing protein n=1 Tax=Amblyomma americanum TaxID=6943 RepID=A0AAQ4DYU2_AMBAM
MHNRYRSQLTLGHLADFPAAGNMLQMRWDKELAEVAQALAERCSTVEGVVTHDRPGDRTTLTFRSVGQNIFSERAPLLPERLVVKWHFVVRDWFDQNYRYSSSQVENYEEVKKTQNFTQIAWARSYAVGCGFTTNIVRPNGAAKNSDVQYRDAFRMFIYVCNYAPAGNVPGKMLYWPGPPCSLCPDGTECNKTTGLCRVTGDKPGKDKSTTTTTMAPPPAEPDDHPPSDSAPEAVAVMASLAAALAATVTAVGAWWRGVA